MQKAHKRGKALVLAEKDPISKKAFAGDKKKVEIATKEERHTPSCPGSLTNLREKRETVRF
jgi:hypothetical protein